MDLLLIDEMLDRKAAAARGIHITGTIGIIANLRIRVFSI